MFSIEFFLLFLAVNHCMNTKYSLLITKQMDLVMLSMHLLAVHLNSRYEECHE